MVKLTTASADFSDINPKFYSCSFSSNLQTTNVILDTGASVTMSSDKSLFSNLIACKISIHIANKDIIHSTHIGIFHLHTILKNGQPITIDLHDSLLVPALNGTTLVSDQSLLKLNFVITLGQNDIHMNLG